VSELVATNGVCPRWQSAIAQRMDVITRTRPRSWDIWSDVMSPAYDDVRDDVNEAIAVTVAFLEYLTDEPLTNDQRKVIAVGIRKHGKSFAFGLSKAIGSTDEWSVQSWFRYASGVAKRIDQERKNPQ
jgi:hypothetical protein